MECKFAQPVLGLMQHLIEGDDSFSKLVIISFILMLQLTIKLINRFSYSITSHFIPSNENYNFCCNPHSVY